jgi:type III restriction enzyme
MHSAIDRLQQRYAEIYLLRNEKLFTIYRFSDGRATEPDFVLFATEKKSGKAITCQLFVEPKGGNLLVEDKWKEDFLSEIEKEYKIQVLFENKEFRLVGMPFYNETTTKTQFEARLNEVLPA